jgi:N4-(beta-N-acetylglucosaminyl)-L-asparaginase
MISRRKFLFKAGLQSGMLTALGAGNLLPFLFDGDSKPSNDPSATDFPLVVSTWDLGQKANLNAWEVLERGGTALDAVEAGVKVVEADPKVTTVGYGGMPDREGRVTLDACIMDAEGNCGSVCFLEHIKHPISVARKIMEETPHVILAGEGALQFALEQGFKKEDLLTPGARKAWKKWKKESNYRPIINVENHDTIGMLAIDQKGNISGACTTSGLGFKMRGRVGDSPIIGAGLFVDNEIGGAVATGLGEALLKTLGTFLVVESMRNGKTPQEACELAIRRIIDKVPGSDDFQIGLIAVSKTGATGAASIHEGFSYALRSESKEGLIPANSLR